MKITSFFPRAQSKEPREPREREPWSPAAAIRGVMATLGAARSSPLPPADEPKTEPETAEDVGAASASASLRQGHDDVASPPSKRRKIASSSGPRPPVKLTPKTSNGNILMTTNGVASELVAAQDKSVAGSPSVVNLASATRSDKRSLRSHDEGTKLKSELGIYIPNYEDMINDVELPTDTLTADTILCIKRSSSHSQSTVSKQTLQPVDHPVVSDSPYNGASVLDFSSLEISVEMLGNDPLHEDIYLKHHKRAERREKQLRNIEKEHAMHEKNQLERLLAGLQGHDWLRVMGITGVTESEAKRYEVKREHCINEVQALINKFVRWKDEEKRLKALRESAFGVHDEAEADQEADEEVVEEVDDAPKRTIGRPRKNRVLSPVKPTSHVDILLQPPDLPFTSFFAKRSARDAAVSKHRPSSRTTILAFGLPVPDLPEKEFALPPDMIAPKVLREHARCRRRAKRESLIDSMS